MNISYQGIGCETVTAKKTSSVKPGDLCYFSADNTVAPANSASGFHGKVLSIYDDNTACVQIRGYIEAAYASTAVINGVGMKGLSCTNATTICSDNSARQYLVVHNDTAKRVLGIML